MSINSEFQKRIIELVSEMDMSKTSIAETIGIHFSSYSKATVYGIIPNLKTLIRIADYFDISLEYLLARSDDEIFYKSDVPVPFMQRFEELREEKQLTYYDLSKRTHIGTNYFANWKKRNNIPALEQLTDLSEFFGVSLDYLLGRTDDK